jgi:hypothetical protein
MASANSELGLDLDARLSLCEWRCSEVVRLQADPESLWVGCVSRMR